MIKSMDKIMNKLSSNSNKIFDFYIILLICSIIVFSRNTMITSCIVGFENSFFIVAILFIPLYIITLKKLWKCLMWIFQKSTLLLQKVQIK